VSSVPHPNHVSTAYAEAWRARTRVFTLRRLSRAAAFLVIGFAVATAGAVTLPLAFGMHSFTVLSGSMEPTIGTGDVLVVDSIRPLDARIGDIVTFRSPEDPSRQITHRVIKMRAAGNVVYVVTRGDANTGVERWSVPASGTIGRAQYRIPKLGYVTNRLGSRFGRFAFLVLPALVLVLSELWRFWRPEPTRGTSDADRP
jgi:signal peptidase I